MSEKQEKITVLLATVKEREEVLKVVLERIYQQLDDKYFDYGIEIHLVLNYYTEVPEWIKGLAWNVTPHLNSQNKNAHDAIWQYMPKDGYVFICDDDLYYPDNYFEKLIQCIERHNRKAVVTAHGSNIVPPVKDYLTCRNTYGFSDELERDIYVDMAGVGTTAFHASTIQPKLHEFVVPFCRDLYFSILCAKNQIKIVSPQRPFGWIAPLKTPGDTVWDMTNSNTKLQGLKNRILKEQFLPALFCEQDNRKYCLITDYNFDERLLTNTLTSLAKVSDCNMVVFSNRKYNYSTKPSDVLTQYVTSEELKLGRMGSKVLTQYRFITSLPTGAQVISADADLHFLKDPFTAFDKEVIFSQGFDIAVTTRPYKYQYPINGGVVMFRVTDKLKRFLSFAISQIYERTWPAFIAFQAKFNHSGNDWFCDQDFWNACYLNRQEILERFDVLIDDIGPSWNFHHHADGASTEQGKEQTLKAFQEKSVAVIHLKSRLKELLFDGEIK